MKRNYKNYTLLASLFIAMIVICVAVSLATSHWMRSRDAHTEAENNHDWLHDALELKEGEIPELELIEEKYSTEKVRLDAEMEKLKKALVAQLRTKDKSDQEVVDSVKGIHQVHGKIQQLEIMHYFDMLSILPPAKRAKLRELATESLSAPPK